METLAALGQGFLVALQPVNLGWGLLGVTLGTFVGVPPGLGPALTIALLLPITCTVDATAAFIRSPASIGTPRTMARPSRSC